MILINLLNFILPGVGALAWIAVWVALTVLLCRQKFPLWESVLLGCFSELGFIAFVADGIYQLTQHRTFFGDPRPASTGPQ